PTLRRELLAGQPVTDAQPAPAVLGGPGEPDPPLGREHRLPTPSGREAQRGRLVGQEGGQVPIEERRELGEELGITGRRDGQWPIHAPLRAVELLLDVWRGPGTV